MENTLINELKKRLDFNGWFDTNTLDENLFIWNFFFSGDEFSEWSIHNCRILENGLMRANRSVWKPDKEENSLLVVNTYECASRQDAHQFIVQLLADYQTTHITRTEKASFGDIAFSAPNNTVIIYARANMIFEIRNGGKKVIRMDSFASTLDDVLTNKQKDDAVKVIPQIQHFRSAIDALKAKDKIPLEVAATDPLDRPLWYKIFYSAGNLFREDKQLIYVSDKSGSQHFTIQAVNSNYGIAEHKLTLDIK